MALEVPAPLFAREEDLPSPEVLPITAQPLTRGIAWPLIQYWLRTQRVARRGALLSPLLGVTSLEL
jgi:hypothetical protein